MVRTMKTLEQDLITMRGVELEGVTLDITAHASDGKTIDIGARPVRVVDTLPDLMMAPVNTPLFSLKDGKVYVAIDYPPGQVQWTTIAFHYN